LADPEHVFTEAVFSAAIVQAMQQVSRADVPDMPDRMVAASAVHFGCACLSAVTGASGCQPEDGLVNVPIQPTRALGR